MWKWFAEMPKLRHKQAEPLGLRELEIERLNYFYSMLEADKRTFDDFTPLNRQEIEEFLFSPNTLAYEIGDGVGLTALIYTGVNAFIQMVMFDWFYREYICCQMIDIAFENGAERVTSTVSVDRNNARQLVLGLGFRYEGTLRQAYYRPGNAQVLGNYVDVELYGLSKEAWNGSDRGRSYRSSGSDWWRGASVSRSEVSSEGG